MPVARIGHDEAAFTAACHEPIRRSNRTPISSARNANVRVVLLRAVNVVRERVVHCNVIKLCGRLVILCGPCFAPIGRNAYAAVIRIAHSIRILRINPETMMVSVPCRQEIESLAAID